MYDLNLIFLNHLNKINTRTLKNKEKIMFIHDNFNNIINSCENCISLYVISK